MGNPAHEGEEAADVLTYAIGSWRMFAEVVRGRRLYLNVGAIVFVGGDDARILNVLDAKEAIYGTCRRHAFNCRGDASWCRIQEHQASAKRQAGLALYLGAPTS